MMRRKTIISMLVSLMLAFIATGVLFARPATAAQPLPELEGGPCLDTYTIRGGDTLGEIAVMCGTSLPALLEANPQIENPSLIFVGDVLQIPEYTGPPIYTTNVDLPPATARPQGVGPGERWIDVDLGAQQLVAYEGNRPVFWSLVSSGLAQYPTVVGQFRIERRYVSKDMDGRPLGYDYYLPDVPYPMYFYRAYALHGTYWHANFGSRMSHGCVNLPTPAAEWLFNWSAIGTVVNVHR